MRKVYGTLIITLCLLALSACANIEKSTEAASVEEEQNIDNTYKDMELKSSLESLGEYKGLEYEFVDDYEPTEEEITKEMLGILGLFGKNEITRENVKEIMGLSSVEVFHNNTANDIKKTIYEENYSDAAVDITRKIMETSSFSFDENEVEARVKNYEDMFINMAKSQNQTVEEFLPEAYKMTYEEAMQEARKASEQAIAAHLIVNAIIDKENLDVKAKWDEEVKRILYNTGFESVEEYMENTDDETNLTEEVKYKVVVDYLFSVGINTHHK